MTATATVGRKPLLAALGLVHRVIDARKKIAPVLNDVLIGADGDALTLTATDLDTTIVLRVDADDVTAGDPVAVRSRKLAQVLRAARTEVVSLAVDGERVAVGINGVTVQLPARPRDEWPEVPTVTGKVSATFDGATLRTACRRLLPSISAEESRFQLNAAQFASPRRGAGTTAASTDGHRLTTLGVAGKVHRGFDALVYRKVVDVLSRVVADSVDFTATEHHVAFRWSGGEVVAKIADGTFPDTARVIDGIEWRYVAMIERAALLSALRPLGVVNQWPRTALVLRAKEGALTATVDNHDLGTSTAAIPCEWEGGDMTIGVNLCYLLGWVQCTDAEAVTLRIKGETSVIGCFGDDGVTHVIMPMRI